MTQSTIQNSFIAGELSPSLFGRTDLAKWKNGASTMRNMFVNYRGPASSRAGLAFVGTSKQAGTTYAPRLIPFQFNINQGYVLEFGDLYMRVISNGAYVVEANNAITNISQANPGVFTYTNTNYSLSNGDWIYVAGVTGMTDFNGMLWVVDGLSGSTFNVKDMFGNLVDTSAYSSYISGGTLARVYTVTSPFSAVDLPYLKFTQSANTMSLCLVNQVTGTEYNSYDLNRNAATDWVFTAASFNASITAPTGITVTANSSTTVDTYYSYVVTAIDAVTGEESVCSSSASAQNNNISIYAGSNVITWNPVLGAGSYNVYKATPSYSVDVPIGTLYGFMGTALGTSLTDTNITADFTVVPPVHKDPFARGTVTSVTVTAPGSGLTQATVGYTVNTSTGAGFIGTPLITGGAFSGFFVINGGKGYAATDTITITNTTGTRASGTYTFTTNPTDGQTIILNGVTWTFKANEPTGNQTEIGINIATTLSNLVNDLNLSTNNSLLVASYSRSGSVVTITYKTAGTAGNAYTLAAGTYGGSVSGATLSGGANGGASAASGSLVIGPQTGTYPGVVAYYQQRRVYANTINNPDTYFFSQPGLFLNFDSSIPLTDSDSITGAPWAQQVNGIQFMVPMNPGLVVLTGGGAWLLNGGQNGQAITPSNQIATSQAYNGCHTHIPPIVINYDMVYVQSKGSIVRDLSFNFFQNVFTGTDVTILSSHLFNYHQLVQWAYAEEPFKVLWAIRDDGIMLSLTYLKEQDVYGWARHDTNGFFVSVCSVTEPPVDAIYVVVKRYIQGGYRYYIERMDNRNWINAEDCFCVDAGLAYPMTYPAAVLTPAAAEGTDNISSTVIIDGGSGYTAPTVEAVDADGIGTGATFSVTLSSGVITAITPILEGAGYVAGRTSLVITDSTGSGAIAQPVITNNVVFTTSASVFTSGNVGDVIRIGNNNAAVTTTGVTTSGGGKAVITAYTSGTQVTANIIEPITSTIPNDPDNRPVPAISGEWSLSTPTTTVSGLNHLEGIEVAILADGSVVPNQTVENGEITLPQAASSIKIGEPFTVQLQTLYLEAGGQETMQGDRKNITSAIIRVENSRGFSVGSNQPDSSTQPNYANVPWTHMVEAKQRNALITAGSAIPLATADFYVNLDNGWSEYGQVAVQQSYPLPLNVSAIVSNWIKGDTSS